MLEDDDVTLLEAELPGVLRLEVVECLAWWLTQLGGSRAGSVSVGRRHAWVEARAELKYFYRLKEWNIFEIKKLKYFWNLDTELFLKFKDWNIFVVAVLTCEGWWVGVPAGEPPGDIKLPLGMLLKQETVRRGQSEVIVLQHKWRWSAWSGCHELCTVNITSKKIIYEKRNDCKLKQKMFIQLNYFGSKINILYWGPLDSVACWPGCSRSWCGVREDSPAQLTSSTCSHCRTCRGAGSLCLVPGVQVLPRGSDF